MRALCFIHFPIISFLLFQSEKAKAYVIIISNHSGLGPVSRKPRKLFYRFSKLKNHLVDIFEPLILQSCYFYVLNMSLR